MLSLTECRKILAETEVSDEYALRLHFCVESLFRRLFLIGLRRQGVQYEIAESIANTFWENPKEFHKRIYRYCGIENKGLMASSGFGVLHDLFINFTSAYRNRRVHGLIGPSTDKEKLALLIEVDKRYVEALEDFFKAEKGLSLFDTPKKWGADKGAKKDAAAVYQELFGREKPERIYTVEKVKGLLKR